MTRCFPAALFAPALLLASFIGSAITSPTALAIQQAADAAPEFNRSNLVAWCIVPFDDRKRTPEERATMMEKLGIKKYAYDYRAEHIPEFDAEMEAIKRHGIELTAWWFPGALNDEAKLILGVLKRHGIKTQLWVTGGGGPTKDAADQRARVVAEADRLEPILKAAAEIGCTVGLYNHGAWFGEPENQIEIIEELKARNLTNVGIVYNQHHGHEHTARFAELLKKMQPYLLVLNLNGMTADGEKRGFKIIPIGQGEQDLALLKTIHDSGYRGPIGILNHTQENAELRLKDNLEGLQWLSVQLSGTAPGSRPVPASWKRPAEWDQSPEKANPEKPKEKNQQQAQPANDDKTSQAVPAALPYDAGLVQSLSAASRSQGDAARGAELFASATSACLSCHKLGEVGGTVGPDLSKIGTMQTVEQLIESVLWPQRQIKPEFASESFVLSDGRVIRAYRLRETDKSIIVRDPASGAEQELAKDEIESSKPAGSLMPDGVTAVWNESQRADLFAFLSDLGKHERLPLSRLNQILDMMHPHAPLEFAYDRKPLDAARWPNWQENVNRERIYDFYLKEAKYFREYCQPGRLVPEFPGLDGGVAGHWGNQSESTWADGRWNQTVLSSLQSGVFFGDKLTVPRAVALQLGDKADLFACFDTDKLNYPAAWNGSFLKFSDVRHGFMNGLNPAGPRVDIASTADSIAQGKPVEYRGFYRHGNRVLFSYRVGDQEFLDAAWSRDGKFERIVAPRDEHPLRNLTSGGPAQWPQVFEVQGKLGSGGPYTVDTIPMPFDNPWHALMFVGDHDFLPDGSALLCTMQGDVWKVSGLDASLKSVRWRCIATGLFHALGLVTVGSDIYVLGRDQITRLHDLNGDEEIDFYECFSRACETSPAGHDFTCGLWRDTQGNFYTASGKQGLVKISADGKNLTVLATGLRNPDGLGLYPDGTVTAPSSEGDWVPASMIAAIPPQRASQPMYFGHGGPRGGKQPDLPLMYLPRGIDNSAGGQAFIDSDRWGPLKGQMVHVSYGAASYFLLLKDEVAGQLQGAVVPMPGEFRSGTHRARFNKHDGQLYVSGMAGWGNYSPDDGCFQRVRYTGEPVQMPIAFHTHENGVTLKFTQPIDESVAREPSRYFAQAWNYRYSGGYGSPEFSTRHIDLRGHDILAVTAVHRMGDGRELFLEIPDIQPVNQLHLLVETSPGESREIFMTVHGLDKPRTDIPGYKPQSKTIAAHPMAVDLARATRTKRNPYEKALPGAREIELETGSNLTFKTRRLTAKPGEPLKLTLINPDVVPHNWALAKPGTLEKVGDAANKLISDPEAVARQYIPEGSDVLTYTDVVPPHSRFVIYFKAPDKPGRYPFLCTFPGHWMVMNGELVIE
ncbi:MAG: TIM barrel protein [Pirellulales bacterium]